MNKEHEAAIVLCILVIMTFKYRVSVKDYSIIVSIDFVSIAFDYTYGF